MKSHLQIAMDEYLPLRDVVFHTLREAILKGDLEPGERLMEIQLASRLGVSRTPIREAIRKLELEGLVTMIPRKGAQVAKITEKDLNDVLEVRCALEELAVELACKKIGPRQIESLKKSVKDFRKLLHKGDVTALAEKDVEFHDIIFSATENKRLIQLLNNLREQMYRYRLEYLKDPDTHMNLAKEHETIITDLEEGNVIEAKKHIDSHIYKQVMAVSKNLEI